MNNNLKRNNIVTAILIVCCLIIGFFLSIYNYKRLDFTPYINSIRVELNQERVEIEDGHYPDSKYPYIVIDLKGTVLHVSNISDIQMNDRIIIEEVLQTDRNFSKQHHDYYKYSMILKQQDSCIGFVIYLIPKSLVNSNTDYHNLLLCFSPISIGIILSIILVMIRSLYCNRRILKPLTQISTSSSAIIAGNYDIEVQRVYEREINANEVGDLIYSFELMRDEIKTKQISESNLRKSQQELISCISHDLRTPISTIKAYSEAVRDGIATTQAERDSFIEVIIKKTNILEKMIAELLEYSNTQLNQMEIIKKEIYFKPYFIEVTRELSIFIKQHGVACTIHYPEKDYIVNMDVHRITEVLYNLVENSLKYIGETDGHIQIIAEVEHDSICIHVIDNGMGISSDDIPYVFDKFYRAEKSRSSNIPGSGLGLSICKYIVNQHNGEIYCRSRKNKGTEFWFTIGN